MSVVPNPGTTVTHWEPSVSIYMCWPVLVPQITGLELPDPPIIWNVSVIQSPTDSLSPVAAVWPFVVVSVFGSANTRLVKSNLMRHTSEEQGHIVYWHPEVKDDGSDIEDCSMKVMF